MHDSFDLISITGDHESPVAVRGNTASTVSCPLITLAFFSSLTCRAGGTDNKGTRPGDPRGCCHGGFIAIDRFGRFTASQRENLVGQHAYGFRVDGDSERYLVFE